ncbi:hypothetical protein OG883_34870 [Streptomyces sp. NBC_01142]|uniref:hypothetical protein n=1 Tax=Streptomyces sp. NBC_01142 TaxID=2975865 RepID=UPI0022561B38|nr:hypothetical protein [Streptomyces sp. NBC_01142]MCX4824952.1 hypothetical protein [Streptomyces sp. NBC_01142]
MTAVTTAPEPYALPTDRRRVLLAPITVTPSKPLTPSHLKGLLWTDVMYRATCHLADVTYRYSHTTYHPTEQTLGFWEFADRTRGDSDYSGLTEDEIGELYVDFRAAAQPAPAQALRPYAEAAEAGWVHPASARVLELWAGHYAGLGLHDPGLLVHQPPGLGLEDTLAWLDTLGMCLDQRQVGGPVYLDLTRYGLPLRQLVTADGRPNYLACALRELLALAPGFDEVVLLYDSELDPDYQLLARVLNALGPDVRRVPVGRVPIDGRIRSARHGGWQDHQARTLLAAAQAQHDEPVVHLGVRLYFIAVLGPGQQQSFRADLLHQCFRRAERLLAAAGQEPPAALAERLARHRKDHLYVDPYRLTSHLLGKRRAPASLDLLTAVFL